MFVGLILLDISFDPEGVASQPSKYLFRMELIVRRDAYNIHFEGGF